MKRCPSCNHLADDAQKFCTIDGTPLVTVAPEPVPARAAVPPDADGPIQRIQCQWCQGMNEKTVQMQLHFEYPRTNSWSPWMSWSHRQLWLRLSGPVRVAVQSAYDPIEDNGRTITRHSNATNRQW